MPTLDTSTVRPVRAFTLVELLVVIGILVVLLSLIVPALTGPQDNSVITKASYDVAGTLESARAYAKANNTYVWVGFFEEDSSGTSSKPAKAGTGQITLSVVASKDGTCIYNSDAVMAQTSSPLDPARLVQVGKLVRIDNMHLAVFSDGTSTGSNFASRPAVKDTAARIGNNAPAQSSLTSFPYPAGSANASPAYVFVKAIEFTPQGEARLNNVSSGFKPIVEIGLLPARNGIVATNSPNPVAIQIAGIAGGVTIYRQ